MVLQRVELAILLLCVPIFSSILTSLQKLETVALGRLPISLRVVKKQSI